MKLVRGEVASFESEMYLTECTWQRKHGWRTPEWKLIVSLEPDFHFNPMVELYSQTERYPVGVHILPKHLDEKVARLQLKKLNVELSELTDQQARYIGVDPAGPYKSDHYRY